MKMPAKNGFTATPPSIVHLEPELDGLPLPGGQNTVADLTPAELTRALMAAGIPGVSATQGKETNARAYEKHVIKLKLAASSAALKQYVGGIT